MSNFSRRHNELGTSLFYKQRKPSDSVHCLVQLFVGLSPNHVMHFCLALFAFLETKRKAKGIFDRVISLVEGPNETFKEANLLRARLSASSISAYNVLVPTSNNLYLYYT